MPKQPGFIDKVNGIINFIENPCFAPWTVYVETALPAAGDALLTLLDFGFDDVVRGFARPRGLRAKPHFFRGGRRGRRGGGIPEIGELIGKAIPGQQQFSRRKVSNGVKHLWLVDGVLQRGLWWWLVADVSVTFAYNWASAIQESAFCFWQNKGYSHWESLPNTNWFSVANAWTTIGTTEFIGGQPPATSQNGGFWNGGRPYALNASFSGSLIPPGPGSFEISYIDNDGNRQISEPTFNPETMQSDIIAHYNSDGAPTVAQYRTNGGVFLGQATCICFET